VYRLGKDVDLSFMLGAELEQISIGLHQIIFNFDSSLSISVVGLLELICKEDTLSWDDGFRDADLSLTGLLGLKIKNVEILSEVLLSITFNKDDYVLKLHDSSDEYESFQIWSDDQEIIV